MLTSNIPYNMFRQSLPQCTCSLFTPQTLHLPTSRSPPPSLNRQALHSKRSLKSQSSSRKKSMGEHVSLMNKYNQIAHHKISGEPKNQLASRIPSSLESHFRAPVVTIRLRQNENQFRTDRKSQAIPFHLLHNNERVSSPLNSQKQNMPNRQISPQLVISPKTTEQQRISLVSPSSIQKMQYNIDQTATNSLACSLLQPNQQIMNRLNKGQGQPGKESKYNILSQMGSTQSDIVGPSSQFIRQVGNMQYQGLSRLQEIMNEKSECQSIYDGEKTINADRDEESRVLVSYKKLIQQKNGILDANDHTKLFDFYRQPNIRNTTSDVFTNVNLLRPSHPL